MSGPSARPSPPGTLAGGVIDGGPWRAAFYTEVPGRVSSKSNARRYSRSEAERAAARRQKAYAATVRTIVEARLPAGWDLGPPPPAPVADRPSVVCVLVAATTLDAPNVPKTLLDACEGLVYHTDAAVGASAQITSRRGTGQRLVVAFAQLGPGASPAELADALTELTSFTTDRFVETDAA